MSLGGERIAAEARADDGVGASFLGRVVHARPDELRPMLWGAAYFFFVMTSYFILRPIRDEMGVRQDERELAWLFTGTLVAMVIANPIFSSLVSKRSVRRFVPVSYHFFALNLVIFFLLLRSVPGADHVWLNRAFFIWTSVFNLFVVSIFWGVMADAFRSEQGKRLFGFIGIGGTLGAVLGGRITALLVARTGAPGLLLVSAVLLEVAVVCFVLFRTATGRMRPVADAAGADGTAPSTGANDHPVGGNALAGLKHVTRSPYLMMIGAYIFLFTIGSTFLYFQQRELLSTAFTDRNARTAFLANVDSAAQGITALLQIFLTGRLIKSLGVGVTLAFLPLASVVGFALLGANPALSIFVVFYVLRRAADSGISRPSREVLFTVVKREDKFKAKNFVDTFVYRTGDQLGAWGFQLFTALGLTFAGKAYIAALLSAVWFAVALWLGRRQATLAREQAAPAGPVRAPALVA